MKRLSISLLVFFLTSIAFAQDKYINSMQSAIAQLYSAQAPADFDPVINTLTRIGQAEPDQWEPHYYVALSQVFKSFRLQEPSAKDAVLDQALAAVKQGTVVAPNNAELLALEGFTNMMKLSVDPATRGQSYTPRIMAAFGRAMALDPTNPRAALFMAQMQIGTAQFFGSSIAEPCQLVQKSIGLFDSFQPNSPISPMWGKEMVKEYAGMCTQTSGQ